MGGAEHRGILLVNGHRVSSVKRSSWSEGWRGLGRRLGLVFIRYHVKSLIDPAALGSVCYVLERDQLLDRLVLEDLCLARGWPSPLGVPSPQTGTQTLWSVRVVEGLLLRRLVPNDDEPLRQLIRHVQAHPGNDVQLIPVAIFLGRAPARERSWIKLLLAEDWSIAGRTRRFLSMLFHGRDTLVKISEPVSLKELIGEQSEPELVGRKAARLLRVHFQRQRIASIGPDFSHRRLLLDEVLKGPDVRAAIRREVLTNHRRETRVRRRARRYAREVAAHYSYPVVRMLDGVFSWLWNRLYDGVQVTHIESLDGIASDAELVYVPCHRSHIDYMLLSYVIYRRGLSPPHIAAGVNLNLPVIGPILRAGGAFFIRRTFKGDALYAAVVRAYFRAILSKGFPIEYFVEGTRSRTGRLLNPKLGLLLMTTQSFLLDRRRPVVFVPVYFGYEKLVEGETFIGELRGKPKQQESLGGLFRSLRTLRERFGTVQVSFGEPIWLEAALDSIHASWREEALEETFRPEWIGHAVEGVAVEIMTAINEAAVINAVNLTSLVVLSMPKQAIVEIELEAQLELYLELSRRVPYAPRTVVTELAPAEIIRHCEEMKWLTRQPNPLGDILRMTERRAVLASYYRNNILHLFTLPSLIAAALTNNPETTPSVLGEQIGRFYPWLKTELFLHWEESELKHAIRAVVGAMIELELLQVRPGLIARPDEGTRRAAQFRLCAEIVQPSLERYYLSVALLLEQSPGSVTRAELQGRCAQAAEQLSVIYWLNSPDLFDPVLFENLVDALLRQGTLWEDNDGRLGYGEALQRLAGALALVLRPRVRQTLRHFARAATIHP